jgi:hypothetical protein
MSLDLLAPPSVPTAEPWARPVVLACAHRGRREPLGSGRHDRRRRAPPQRARPRRALERRADPRRIKSIRVREVLDAALKLPGYRGILAFTLPEALWLAEEHDDIVLGYPSVDRAALAALAAAPRRPPASP